MDVGTDGSGPAPKRKAEDPPDDPRTYAGEGTGVIHENAVTAEGDSGSV